MGLCAIVFGCASPPAERAAPSPPGRGLPAASTALAPSPEPVDSAAAVDAGSSDAAVDAKASEPSVHYPFADPVPEATLPASSPARRFANLSAARCRAEAKARGLDVRPAKVSPKHIATPVRIAGAFHSVRFVAPHAPSKFGLVECRLALALDELASVLAAHDVVSVRVDNAYRPQSHLPGSKKRSQHAYGLAVDITSLELADGRTLTAESDWHAEIGDPVCGPNAVMNDPTETSILLRTIVCDVARHGIFQHLLTPSFNAAHRTHFHFDIQRDNPRWSIH
jgi:hypothetical protein